jgi:alpha/beta superfamily hydrolase
MGGDRFNNVVSSLFDALPAAGVTALRFDFSSSNVDVAAAEAVEMLDLLSYTPRFVVGYSFGGGIASRIVDDRIAGRCLIAPSSWAQGQRDFVIAAEHDQFFPTSDLQPDAVVSGADHFFAGRTSAVVELCLGYLRQAAR